MKFLNPRAIRLASWMTPFTASMAGGGQPGVEVGEDPFPVLANGLG